MIAQRRQSIDPVVADLLSGLESRQADRKLPRKERERKAKERAKSERRNRVMLDLPIEVEKRVVDLAASLKCSISQTATALLVVGMAALEREEIDLHQHRKLSRSPRYEFNLDVSEIEKSIR